MGVPEKRIASSIGLVLTLGLAACEAPTAPTSADSPPTAPAAPTPDIDLDLDRHIAVPFAARFTTDGVYRLDPNLPLPFRRNPVLGIGKADEFDNTRAAAPQNFAITAPPERIATVRPMVEWEPMQALVFAFPSWAASYSNTTSTFVNIAKVASDYGEVWVIVDSTSAENVFKQRLTQAGVPSSKFGSAIRFWRQTFDSYWLVDFGPLPIVDTATNTFSFSDFRYYHERPLDDAISTLLGRNLTRFGAANATSVYRMPLTTEGGTFQSTTDGVCITGSRQIYNMSCNAGTCRESILGLSLEALQTHQYTLEMKSVLQRYSGCKDLIVTHSVTDDGTGHIDIYLKILDDDRILIGDYEAPYTLTVQRENSGLMDDNAAFLEAYIRPNGETFQVVRMPMPGHQRVEDFWGEYDVPFTYINSTFFNGVNLWPAYGVNAWQGSKADAQAIWEQVLPDMEHVAIDSEELAFQSGAIHCVTRTIPAMAPGLWVEPGACTDGVCGGAQGGYDGQCQIGSNNDLCFGPDWLCGCNDCRNCPESTGSGCSGVSWRGCCEGGDVLYCENAQLKKLTCGGTGCGWSSGDGFYNCGLEGADPTGEAPAQCDCTPQCDGKTCGEDGCGGTCGTCGDGDLCVAGSCRSDCESCTPGASGCEGQTSWLCVGGPEGCHSLDRVDCAASGLVCVGGSSGQCESPPNPDPDPSPDVVEPNPEVEDTSTPADTETPTDSDGGPTIPVDTGKTSSVRDEGCGSGGGDLPAVAALMALAWFARRRLFAA